MVSNDVDQKGCELAHVHVANRFDDKRQSQKVHFLLKDRMDKLQTTNQRIIESLNGTFRNFPPNSSQRSFVETLI